MKLILNNKNLQNIQAEYEIIFFKSYKNLDKNTKIILNNDFSYIKNKFYFCFERKKIYINIKKISKEDLKTRYANLAREILKYKINSLKFQLIFNKNILDIQLITEGLILGSYEFRKYNKTSVSPVNVYISYVEKSKDKFNNINKLFLETMTICNSVNYARDIVNTSPQNYYPSCMAKDALELSKIHNVSCKVYEEKSLKEMGLNAIVEVSKASVHDAKLIHLQYKPRNAKFKIVLLGKGVTYDTGGLSLKRGDGMVSMKCDKAGAITVLGIVKASAQLKIPIEIHGVLGAVENMIDSNALVPGDIIKMGTKNVEITNTDAEGRLVLADCILFTNKYINKYDYIFDFATLTGASINCFGGYSSVIISKNEKLIKDIQKSSKKTGELVSLMEQNRYLEGRLKSSVADIVNSPKNKNASSIIGSMFLSEFFNKDDRLKWLHFDMAGPSFRREVWGCNPYGASGYGIRLMINYLKKLTKSEK